MARGPLSAPLAARLYRVSSAQPTRAPNKIKVRVFLCAKHSCAEATFCAWPTARRARSKAARRRRSITPESASIGPARCTALLVNLAAFFPTAFGAPRATFCPRAASCCSWHRSEICYTAAPYGMESLELTPTCVLPGKLKTDTLAAAGDQWVHCASAGLGPHCVPPSRTHSAVAITPSCTYGRLDLSDVSARAAESDVQELRLCAHAGDRKSFGLRSL